MWPPEIRDDARVVDHPNYFRIADEFGDQHSRRGYLGAGGVRSALAPLVDFLRSYNGTEHFDLCLFIHH